MFVRVAPAAQRHVEQGHEGADAGRGVRARALSVPPLQLAGAPRDHQLDDVQVRGGPAEELGGGFEHGRALDHHGGGPFVRGNLAQPVRPGEQRQAHPACHLVGQHLVQPEFERGPHTLQDAAVRAGRPFVIAHDPFPTTRLIAGHRSARIAAPVTGLIVGLTGPGGIAAALEFDRVGEGAGEFFGSRPDPGHQLVLVDLPPEALIKVARPPLAREARRVPGQMPPERLPRDQFGARGGEEGLPADEGGGLGREGVTHRRAGRGQPLPVAMGAPV